MPAGRGSESFTWGDEARLTQATVAGVTDSYTYRPDGLRHSKTVGGATTTYVWDANRSIPVVLQDGTNSHLYGLGPISSFERHVPAFVDRGFRGLPPPRTENGERKFRLEFI